jgi:O-antigen ligase
MSLDDGVYTMAHNTFLQVAVETGLVGLCLYLLVIFEPARRQHGALAGTVFLVFAAVIVSGLAENTLRTREYDFAVWPLLGALVAAREPMRRAREAAP